jgi:hypothetical protein
VERFGEPWSWWMNQKAVLAATAARSSVARVLDEYGWIWRGAGLKVPIDPTEYYPVAVEANGDVTLVHRENGRIVLFAPDHSYPRVRPFPGCPPRSLLTIDDLPDLASWLEECTTAG